MVKEVEQNLLYINKQALADSPRNNNHYPYTGADIRAVMYMPLYGARNKSSQKFKVFADLQTISISRTRSVSPVRVLGRADPIGYTRGARTIAGTMVFAVITKDAFNEIYDVSVAESLMSSSTGFVADQLPPFSVVIVASNEHGGVAMQILHGITLTNYGTTYSVNDMYTEATYTYVATQLTPLNVDPHYIRAMQAQSFVDGFTSISSKLTESLGQAYSSTTKSITEFLNRKPASSKTYAPSDL